MVEMPNSENTEFAQLARLGQSIEEFETEVLRLSEETGRASEEPEERPESVTMTTRRGQEITILDVSKAKDSLLRSMLETLKFSYRELSKRVHRGQ